jgi:DNA-binding CsgD family transcriptional regulator
MAIAERTGSPDWAVGHLTGWYVGDVIEAGDMEAAMRAVAFGADAPLIRHQPYGLTVLINCRAMLALHAGRFDEAEQLVNEGLCHASRRGQVSGAAAVQLFTARREQGRLAELAPVLEHFQRTVPDSVTWQPGYIVLCCELGRRDQAQAAFERLARLGFEIGSPDDGARAGGLVYLAEACCWLGDASRADALYALLLPHAGKGIVFGAHVVSLGSAERVLGMLSATLRRWDEAQAHFERAIAFDAASGARPWLAHDHHEYAAMLVARQQLGDAQRAGELLDKALTACRELGMRALEARVLALQPGSRGSGHLVYPAGLTEREVQVLRMVAEGKTNQDIADALFRSVNTVANHVRHILAKIDAANRTEAAAFAARHGLLKR